MLKKLSGTVKGKTKIKKPRNCFKTMVTLRRKLKQARQLCYGAKNIHLTEVN